MTRSLGPIAGIVVLAMLVSAHVGSYDTFFAGAAGPYHVRVIVRSPGVVPGLAQITVRVPPDARARRVTVLPVRWDAGTGGAPPADVAEPVPGDSTLYSAALWLMTFGSYSVHVTVEGAAGTGTAIVPVQAVATRRLEMRRPLGIALAALGLFLFVGAVTIIRAAVRDAVLEPGAPERLRTWRARIAGGVATVLLAAVAGLGAVWWDDVDAAYRENMYEPFDATASVRWEGGQPILRFAIDDSVWLRRTWTPLVPDHGKLMHLFLVRDALDAFAHLHPVPLDSNTFETPLPPLLAGSYRVYADIVHESGFAQTLTDTVAITPPTGARRMDPDDGWWTGSRQPSAVSRQHPADTLSDGSVMTWELDDRPVVAGEEASLVFSVRERDGRPAQLEPYLGMAAHAALTRDDGSVFVHLHPLGTISWAAQMTFVLRTPADTVRGAVGRKLTEMGSGERGAVGGVAHRSAASQRTEPPPAPRSLSFPYAFPTPGRYHIWVQVKRGGRVLTGGFVAEVGADR